MKQNSINKRQWLILSLSCLSGLSLLLTTTFISWWALHPGQPPPLPANQEYFELPEGHPPIPRDMLQQFRSPGQRHQSRPHDAPHDTPFKNKILA